MMPVPVARERICHYRRIAMKANPTLRERALAQEVSRLIIARYATPSAISGVITSLAGILPGIGTFVAIVLGGLIDAIISLKLQMDMTLCLCLLGRDRLSDKEAVAMAQVIAFAGSIEPINRRAISHPSSWQSIQRVEEALARSDLQTGQTLGKKAVIKLISKSIIKALPYGLGAILAALMNFAMIWSVGRVAIDVLGHTRGHASML